MKKLIAGLLMGAVLFTGVVGCSGTDTKKKDAEKKEEKKEEKKP